MTDVAVQELRKAMKGLGTNDKQLISHMCKKRTNAEMQALIAQYTATHNRDLVKDIKSETSFNYKKVLVSLTVDAAVYDARLVNAAVKGIGTNEDKLNEIVCTRSAPELKLMQAAYEAEYKKPALEDILADVSGRVKQLYTALLTSDRVTPPDTSLESHALELYNAGENKMGTNEDKFIEILGNNSKEYVLKLNKAYLVKYGHDLAKVVKSEFSFDIADALKAVVRPEAEYYAKQLRKAMECIGTDDEMLTRVLVTQRHYPGRMAAIAAAFEGKKAKADKPKKDKDHKAKKDKKKKPKKEKKDPSKHSKSLREYIMSEASGDYEKALIAILDNFSCSPRAQCIGI